MEPETPGTILVVDDTPANLRLLAGALSSRGYRVLAFPSGALALAAMAREAPDIVLLDIDMPGMNGYEVAAKIKEDESLRDVPILFISALQDTSAKLEAFASGGLDYITKPFRLEEVFARVETHMELSNLREQLAVQNEMLDRAYGNEREVTDRLRRVGQGRIEAQQRTLEFMARMAGLTQLSDLCAKFDSERELIDACGQVAKRVTGSEYVELVLMDASGLRFQSIPLHEDDGIASATWVGKESVPWLLEVLDQGTKVSDDLSSDPSEWGSHLSGLGWGSAMALPVMAGSTTVGILTAASRFSEHFDDPAQNIIQQFASAIGSNLGLCRALRGLESSLDRADAVLVSVLPRSVSRRLKGGESQIADRVPLAGVFFCDLAGFTAYSSTTEPEEVVAMLQETFSLLETACKEHQVEKIKTIGDAFMAVSGVSVPVDDPIGAMADFAMAAAALLKSHLSSQNIGLGFRIGIHAGPVLAGVIGSDRLFFDVWGDTVNFASRLESSGRDGDIRCSDEIRAGLGEGWSYEDCGKIPLKGKGEQQVWSLLARP